MRGCVKASAPKKESNKPLGGSCERLRTGVWIKRKDHVTFFRGFKALALVGRIDRLIQLLVFYCYCFGRRTPSCTRKGNDQGREDALNRQAFFC
jgi:hypothetical protein